MPEMKMVDQTDFSGLLDMNRNIFSMAKGSVPFLFNMMGDVRGSLRTIQGTSVVSTALGTTDPFVAVNLFFPPSGLNTVLGMTQNSLGYSLWNISTTDATIIESNLPGSSSPPPIPPQIVPAPNNVVLAMGYGIPPLFYTGSGSPAVINNVFNAGSFFLQWQQGVQYYTGSTVQVGDYTFKAIQGGTSSSSGNPWAPNTQYGPGAVVTYVVGGVTYAFKSLTAGQSGGSAPAFPAGTGATVSEPSEANSTSTSVQGSTTTNTTNYGYLIWQNVGVAGPPNWSNTYNSTVQDGTVVWQNIGVAQSTSPPGAMHAIYHMNSLWLWGVGATEEPNEYTTGPSALWVTDVNTLNSFNPLNMFYVAAGNGQKAMGAAVMSVSAIGIEPTSSLILFKEYSTYQVMGAPGASNFSIVAAQTNMGCVAPRTIQFVSGLGVIRMTHMGVAIFNGENDQLISDPVRTLLFGERGSNYPQVDWTNISSACAAITVNPSLYLLGLPTVGSNGKINLVLIYDLILMKWSLAVLPFYISSMAQILINSQEPVTIIGSSNEGKIRRWFYNDSGWDDPSNLIQWSMQTPMIFEKSTQRMYIRMMQMRASIITPFSIPNVTATIYVAQAYAQPVKAPWPSPNMNIESYYDSGFYYDQTYYSLIENNPYNLGPAEYGTGIYAISTYSTGSVYNVDNVLTYDVGNTGYGIQAIFSGSGDIALNGFTVSYMTKPGLTKMVMI